VTELERLIQWLQTCEGSDRIQTLRVDYLPASPETGAILPSGLTELSRKEDVFGNVHIENQYRFGLYYTLTGTDAISNAAWLLGVQKWIQEQSVRRLAPTFGDEPASERMQAQNGILYADHEDGTATYRVELTVNFKSIYEVM